MQRLPVESVLLLLCSATSLQISPLPVHPPASLQFSSDTAIFRIKLQQCGHSSRRKYNSPAIAESLRSSSPLPTFIPGPEKLPPSIAGTAFADSVVVWGFGLNFKSCCHFSASTGLPVLIMRWWYQNTFH
jgi:hypothetical protein